MQVSAFITGGKQGKEITLLHGKDGQSQNDYSENPGTNNLH